MSTWENWNQTYQIKTYLPISREKRQWLDAYSFLKMAREIFVSLPDMEDSYCIIAGISTADGRAAYLKIDRDYYEICEKSKAGTRTLAYWQGSLFFRGYMLKELWGNMILLLENKGKPSEDLQGGKHAAS